MHSHQHQRQRKSNILMSSPMQFCPYFSTKFKRKIPGGIIFEISSRSCQEQKKKICQETRTLQQCFFFNNLKKKWQNDSSQRIWLWKEKYPCNQSQMTRIINFVHQQSHLSKQITLSRVQIHPKQWVVICLQVKHYHSLVWFLSFLQLSTHATLTSGA